MKKIMMLRKDGTVKNKNEKKISQKDIHQSEYFLVSTNNDIQNYVIIKPSKYNIFDKAIIDYQLCVAYPDFECSDDTNYHPINPVHVETDSLCDLICLINSIDLLNSTNFVLTGNTISDDYTCLAVMYFGVQLISDDKVIYNEVYQLKGTSSVVYDSYKVASCFKKIYSPIIISNMAIKLQFLNLYTKDGNVWWDIDSLTKCDMVGIPLTESSTITFCDYEKYMKLSEFKEVVMSVCVYYERDDFISELSESFANGSYYTDYDYIVDRMKDVFYDDTYYITHSLKPTFRLIDIMSHIVFILSSIDVMYKAIYSYPSIYDDKKHDFDTLLAFKLYTSKKRNDGKMIVMNRYSIIDLNTIISSL